MSGLSRWPHADELLDRALELPEGERVAFARQVAGADAALADALVAVLAEARAGASFLPEGGALSGALGREVAEALGADSPPARLLPGTRLEHYEIKDVLGRGGMGEVYRATDTRLQRDVAIKVLPDQVAADPTRLARFRREARLLAALNHPGIASIYGVVEADGVEALVLELVDGPTLAERLAEGPLPMPQFLAAVRSLVDAIAAAHASSVLHRDLKPANIKLLADGTVKVLDFGLAKALDAGAAGDAAKRDTEVTSAAARGVLGTAPYMSPEQVRGDMVDQRADIWAFGCVVFEMRSGRRAFGGDSIADVFARIIEREPAYGLLAPDTPAPIRRLIRHSLEKDAAHRLADMRDAHLYVDDAINEPAAAEPASSRTPWVAVAAAVVVTAAVTAWALSSFSAAAPPVAPLTRLAVPLPAGDRAVLSFQPVVAVSPDGRTLVYRARRDGTVQLFRRSLSALDPAPIAGTENGTAPFFSPDGEWLGFDADGVLKRVPLSGGEPVTIAPTPGTATSTWLPGGDIIFATNTQRVLQRVPANGGTPQALSVLDAARGDTLHLLPQALPDGRTILYTIVSGATRQIAVLRLDTGESRILTPGTHARYVAPGFLVLARDGALWSVPFDAERLEVGAPAVPLATAVADNEGTVMHYDVSVSGTLAYLPVRATPSLNRLAWLARDGREEGGLLQPGRISRIGLADGGARVLAAIETDGNVDIWVADAARGTVSRLTSEPTLETMPTPSPDGRLVAFRSERAGPGIFARDIQGAKPFVRLTETSGPIQSPYSWTPDGRTLLLAVFRSYSRQAIASVTPPSTEVRVLLDGEFAQLDPQVSPDGRWIAYQSDETGRFEIYVRPYPDVESGRWQISPNGGTTPRWNPRGGELFYFDGSGLVAAPISTGRVFTAGTPSRLFDVQPPAGRLGTDYEVDGSGARFLFILPASDPATAPESFVLVQHWTPPAS